MTEDTNNVGHLISLDAGCKTKVGRPTDCSSAPLISLKEDIWKRPVYKRLRYLYNNYDEDVTRQEDRSSYERREEQNFLREIMATSTMKTTFLFLEDPTR